MRLRRVATSIRYADFFPQRPSVGHETLLYDCMAGDATLFQRADAIEASWAAVQQVLDAWGAGEPETCGAGGQAPTRGRAAGARGAGVDEARRLKR